MTDSTSATPPTPEEVIPPASNSPSPEISPAQTVIPQTQETKKKVPHRATGKPRGRPRKIPASHSTPKMGEGRVGIGEGVYMSSTTQSPVPVQKQPSIPLPPPIPVPHHSTVIPSPNNSPQTANSPSIGENALSDALTDRGDHLDRVLQEILPTTDSRARKRLAVVIAETVDGNLWTAITVSTGVTWAQVTRYNQIPAFRALWQAAREAGEGARKEIRAATAHSRAVDGWEEPTFYQGKRGESKRVFDNRLLEFLMKADDPAKYRENSQVNVNNQVGVIVEFHKDPDPAPESATNPLPAPAIDVKPEENSVKPLDTLSNDPEKPEEKHGQ